MYEKKGVGQNMNKESKKETFAADTSGRSAADWIRALLVLLFGLAVAHLGVTLFLLSDLGTDTFTREFDTLKSKKVPQSLEIGLFFCQIFIFII